MRIKNGFTLAEVLITLGIIGVVAAITIPSLITQFKRTQMQTQFKKADSVVSQAIKSTLYELEYDKFSDLDVSKDTPDDDLEKIKKEYNDIWAKQFKGATRFSPCKQFGMNKPMRGFFLEKDGYRNYCWIYGDKDVSNSHPFLLPDGSAVSEILSITIPGYSGRTVFYIAIDTNGPYAGPNAWGYDVFYILAENNERIFGMLCDPFVKNTANLHGCYWYAHKNTSAFKGINYWSTLYRNKSYLEKLK